MNQPNYPYVQGPGPVMLPHNSSTAVISLIAGIAGLTIFPGIGSIVAIITGYMARNEIRNGGGMVTGSGMATWGLVLGYIGIAVGLCLCVMAIVFSILGIALPFGLTIPFLFNTPSSGY